ncbi:signal peptidase, peptidase S26 [Pseudoscourfieldia marina]
MPNCSSGLGVVRDGRNFANCWCSRLSEVHPSSAMHARRAKRFSRRSPLREKGPSSAKTRGRAFPRENLPPLHRAARTNDLATLRDVLTTKEARRRENVPLITATITRSKQTANISDDVVSVDLEDKNGSTPLMHACEKRNADAARILLEQGACARKRNKYGWSAYEYLSESLSAGVLAPDARAIKAATSRDAALAYARVGTKLREALLDAGAEADGYTPVEYGENLHVRLMRDGGTTLDRAAVERVDGPSAVRYALGAARTTIEAVRRSTRSNAANTIVVGSQAVPGITSRRLGLYAGVRYVVQSLEWRPKACYQPEETRIVAASVDDQPPRHGGAWELVARLHHPACTPWGSVEIGVNACQLHTISDELSSSIRLGTFAAILPLVLTATALPFRLVSVDGLSMLPTLREKDVILVDTRASTVSRSLHRAVGGIAPLDAPVVWLDVPDNLRALARQLGKPPPPRNARLLKRVVAGAGDSAGISEGTLFVNGVKLETTAPCYPGVDVACKLGAADVAPTGMGVGESLVYVLGDNRGRSSDSTLFGGAEARSVRGVARVVLWPPEHARLLPKP